MVTIYSTPTCAFCKVEKQWLDSKGVKYDVVDLSEDGNARKELADKGMVGVPITKIGDTIIKGFDRKQIEKALAWIETKSGSLQES